MRRFNMWWGSFTRAEKISAIGVVVPPVIEVLLRAFP